MTRESRRKVLKGLAVTLPATWATPIVESIVLPAHARSSPAFECVAPSGCYEFDDAFAGEINWPGGSGPHTLNTVNSCSSATSGIDVSLVVAASQQEANDRLECGAASAIEQTPLSGPALEEGCNFYVCGAGSS